MRNAYTAMATHALEILARAQQHLKGGADVCFVIHRSSNDNSVVYKGVPEKGVDVFWIMFEKPGAPTEDLTTLEKNTAYGTTIIQTAREKFEIQLSALKDKSIFICKEGERWCARTTIDGVPDKKLQAVHVEMVKGAWIPAVAYVEIFGEGAYEQIEKVVGSGTAAKAKALEFLQKQRSRVNAQATIDNNSLPPDSAQAHDDKGAKIGTVVSPKLAPGDKVAKAGVVPQSPKLAPSEKVAKAGTVVSRKLAPGDKVAKAGVVLASAKSEEKGDIKESSKWQKMNLHFRLGEMNRAFIHPGSKFQMMLSVEAGATLQYLYTLNMLDEGVDIGFQVEFVGKAGKSIVLPYKRGGLQWPEVTQNTVTADALLGDGKLLITFDNRYSIVKSKNVLYRFNISSDEDRRSKAQQFCKKMSLQNSGRSASLSEYSEAYVAASAAPLPPGAVVPV